jgi:LysR family glycine cleavage system transcriptional activator
MVESRFPPLASIRAFEAAARHGKFAAAARELGMSAAAVSYHVRQLERATGVRLFVRLPHRVELTGAGRRVADEAIRAFAGLRASFADAADLEARHLTITTLPSLGTSWLTPRLGAFRAVHPDIRVTLDLSAGPQDLAGGAFDAAIRNGHGEWPGMASHLLFPSLFLPLCAPALAEAAQALDRRGAPLPPLLGRPDWWAIWYRDGGLDPPDEDAFGTTLAHEYLDITAAIAGHGIAIGSPILFARELAAGTLVAAHPRVARDGRSFWLAYPAARRKVARIAALRGWLLQEAANATEAGRPFL